MSQTETLLLVVLGFSLGALIFLFVGRFVWNLGLRVGTRRMQRKVPGNVADLQTERDRLRAEYALLSQKLSARLETAKLRMAEQLAETTRNRNRLASMVITLNTRDVEIERLKQEAATLGDNLKSSGEALAAASSELASLKAERENLLLRLTESETAVALLEQKLASVPLELASSDPAGGLQSRIEALTTLSNEIAESRAQGDDSVTSVPADPVTQETMDQAAIETADLQQELARLDAAWEERLAEASAKAGGAPRGVANVISLAARIKALQGEISQKK